MNDLRVSNNMAIQGRIFSTITRKMHILAPGNHRIGEIKSVELLGHDEPIQREHHPDGLWVVFPQKKPCDSAYCLKITSRGSRRCRLCRRERFGNGTVFGFPKLRFINGFDLRRRESPVVDAVFVHRRGLVSAGHGLTVVHKTIGPAF
jgi:hypothetical protein